MRSRWSELSHWRSSMKRGSVSKTGPEVGSGFRVESAEIALVRVSVGAAVLWLPKCNAGSGAVFAMVSV
ncbi:hypothetical protein FQZ97_972810 [compost metagenome]